MKSRSIKSFILAVAIMASSLPSVASAQSVAGIAGGAASCAMGAAIQNLITSAVTGFFTDKAKSAVTGAITGAAGIGPAVPVTDSETHSIASSIDRKEGNQEKKSFWLDRLASCAAKQVLHQMTADTITWINTGFKGGPAFLTNPKGFFLDVADQVTGMMIDDSGPLKQLCSPWNIDIRLALAIDQSLYNSDGFDRTRYQCTLSKIINNGVKNATINGASIEGFIKGDFSQGGWPAFIELTTVPANNRMGAYLMAKSDIYDIAAARKTAVKEDLARGQGFMSWEKCEEEPYTRGADLTSADGLIDLQKNTILRCSVQTPGSVIANALNVHTSSGVVQAELANDINSVVSALSTALINKMLSTGLASLNSSGSGFSYGGRTSLTSAVADLRTREQSYSATDGTFSYGARNGTYSMTETPASYYTKALEQLQIVQSSIENGLTGCKNTDAAAKLNAILDSAITPKIAELTEKQQLFQGSTSFSSQDVYDAQLARDEAVAMAAKYNPDIAIYTLECDSPINQQQ